MDIERKAGAEQFQIVTCQLQRDGLVSGAGVAKERIDGRENVLKRQEPYLADSDQND